MSRPTKKRALMATESLSTEQQLASTPASSSSSSSVVQQRRPYPTSLTTTPFGTTANLDASVYKAELEHERSLRALDAKRAQQVQQRLERQVEFAVEEAESAKSMLEEERSQSESHMEQLRQARDDAMQQLRELQYAKDNDDDDDSDEEEERDSSWRRQCELLQSNLEAKEEEMAQLRNSLKTMQDQMRESMIQNDNKKDGPSTPPDEKSAGGGQSSPAPADLLSELNRVRIALAEAERKQRQSRRAAEEWQKKAKQLLPEREAARSSNLRVQQLETQLRDVRQKYLSTEAKNEQWQTFGKALTQHFSNANVKKEDISTPPEVSSILRQVEATKKELEQVKNTNLSLEQRLEKIQDWKRPTEARMKTLDEQETKWQQDRKDLEKQLDLQTRQLETLQKQEAIWKREIAGLQRLVQTFDELPINSSSGSSSSAAEGISAKLQTVELELKSKQEELELVKQDRTRIHQELSKIQQEHQDQRRELHRVKEKYGKLREALEVQRGKAQEAEARANRAEELSGKGSFNPAETRVLHLQKNPLSQTLQEQNAELRKQLREALQSKGVVGGDLNISMTTTAAAANSGTEVDPDKLHQRLKQSFKEQIGLFREGVHLITGFKIDMLPVDDHRPTFRVRSMYGERETDELLLKWPKLPEGQHPKSMDLLGTEWANTLAATESYEYLSKFDSLPAFLASLQLKLFESQTFMG